MAKPNSAKKKHSLLGRNLEQNLAQLWGVGVGVGGGGGSQLGKEEMKREKGQRMERYNIGMQCEYGTLAAICA